LVNIRIWISISSIIHLTFIRLAYLDVFVRIEHEKIELLTKLNTMNVAIKFGPKIQIYFAVKKVVGFAKNAPIFKIQNFDF
jgi:hypothetical protein